MKEKKKFSIEVLYIFAIFIIVYFGIKILSVIITIPILTMYGAAYDWYLITNDPIHFEKAAEFVNSWLIEWVLLAGGIVLFVLIRKKRNKE